MIDHGIDVSRGNEEGQAGTAEAAEALRRPPVRLGNHTYPIAPAFQETGDQRGAKGGVIHIGITGYEDKVEFAPPSFEGLFPGHRKESVHVRKYTQAGDMVAIADFCFSRSRLLPKKGGNDKLLVVKDLANRL